MTHYQINMVRYLRRQEREAQKARLKVLFLCTASSALLVFSVLYALSNIRAMRNEIQKERQRLQLIETEYRKYRETRTIIDKADIELLDSLQRGRIFWTGKLASMAFHLPNQPPNPYWITSFAYNRNIFNVKGYGYISPKQEQLITIDDYLNSLRSDTTYNRALVNTYLNATQRTDEGRRERVNFEFSSTSKGGRR